MFHRFGKRKMSLDETAASRREAELRQTMAHLREQLDEERSAKRQAQYDKVGQVRPCSGGCGAYSQLAVERAKLLKRACIACVVPCLHAV